MSAADGIQGQKRRVLSSRELWELSAQALHDNAYVYAYVGVLEGMIRNRNSSILDTASGLGFPTEQLYDRGFHRIDACDADAASVRRFQLQLERRGVSVKVFQSTWQDLAYTTCRGYDVILNVDNSFVYMDGWEVESPHYRAHFRPGKEHAFQRGRSLLLGFHNTLNPNGSLIIGIGKHYQPPSKTYSIVCATDPGFSFNTRFSPVYVDGMPITITWHGCFNWEERVHDWWTTIEGDTVEGVVLRRSYLYTKNELAQLMVDVGFARADIVENEDMRDDLVVGIK